MIFLPFRLIALKRLSCFRPFLRVIRTYHPFRFLVLLRFQALSLCKNRCFYSITAVSNFYWHLLKPRIELILLLALNFGAQVILVLSRFRATMGVGSVNFLQSPNKLSFAYPRNQSCGLKVQEAFLLQFFRIPA